MNCIKYLLVTSLFLLSIAVTRAQDVPVTQEETITRTSHDRVNLTEKYSVLKSDKKTKQGVYQAYDDGPFAKTVLIAMGKYDHGKKVGVWHYFGKDGSVQQHYDFTHDKLLYTLPDSTTKCTYDIKPLATDTLTCPIKIGGTNYGYHDFIIANYDAAKNDMRENGHGQYLLSHILDIGADGKLASYQLAITADGFKKVYNIKLESLSEDDLLFVPATLNRKPVASIITLETVEQR
ncbi:hypothetical protein [Mucilaginibacter sp. PPCGB 2223]|uniref:hypothetical protein n=1 Tax=Mucilaginibacter sp. PPCGB 2223 TaxID=1886027 RepID=UPI001111E5BF|nr:hypothetical protein [Mucilaginibacter sp. PPCGB 2223]